MIIGITGTIGAGKGTAVEHLIRRGFRHFSARAFIAAEIQARGLVLNRDSLVQVANDLRHEHGSAHIIEALTLQALARGGPSVLESIRTLGEVAALRSKPHTLLLAIDADPALRYRRLRARGSETDTVTRERFLTDEAREMENSDPTKQNLRACIATADALLLNNAGTEEFFAELDRVLLARGFTSE